jgi:hypothetical protein
MNLKFGFHHFVLVLLPVLFIFVDNINELPLNAILIPLSISLLIILIPWIVMKYLIGEGKSSIILTILIISFLIFSFTRSVLIYHEIEEIRVIASNLILIPIFLLPITLIIIQILRKEFSSDINQIMNVVSITVFSFLVFQIGLFYSVDVSHDEAQKLLDVPIFSINESSLKPNVYFLLLDAYSGNITLKNDFGYDNSEFYNQLEQRGFFVQKESYSNYPNTGLSIPSIVNMNYLDFLVELQGTDSTDMRLPSELSANNKVMQVFESLEYDIYSFYGKEGQSKYVTENFCKYYLDLHPELMSVLINYYIPISIVRENLSENKHYNNVMCILETTMNFENKNDRPFYMHMHVMFPHQPLVFDSEGNKINDPIAANRFDGELKNAYLQQLIFANKKTLEIIDSIQEKNPDNVIILMSDHGGRFGVDWADPTEMDYFRGFNNLSALYFPGQESNIPNYVSSVNIFRIFFNLYFDTNYEILDERLIWYDYTKPFVHNDVTELVKSSSLRN